MLSLLFLLSVGLRAQDPPTISTSLEVRMITVEVVVTDRQGNRVTGLKSDDFQLFVNDQFVEPAFFQKVWNPRVTASGKVEGIIDLAERPADAQELGNSYLVFIDDYFTPRKFRPTMFKRIGEQVSNMGPRDRMAIVRFDGKKLEPILDYSGDQGELERAFKYARGLKSKNNLRRLQLESREDLESVSPIYQQLRAQLEQVTDALMVTMRSFYTNSGRRVMLLMSPGWTSDFTLLGDGADTEARDAARRFDSTDLLDRMVDTANLLGYTVYPIQSGLPIESVTAESAESPVNFNPIYTEFNSGLNSLRTVASETGGAVVAKAVGKVDFFQQVTEDTNAYYILGFMAEAVGSVERSNIRVELTDESYRVRHRKSFRVLTKSEQVGMDMDASLMLGITKSSLPLTVGNGKTSFTRLKVPVTLHIPMDWATQTPYDGRYMTQLVLHTTTLDTKGYRSDKYQTPIRMVGGQPGPGMIANYEVNLTLSKRPQRVVLSLQDVATGKVLTRHVDLNPRDHRKKR
ncbi:MAG: VWA domain-containing protein [Acidobacteriota bacterium]|nr:VWA domain-containing protein [Acidobacteriota bacterium]